jgi:predicted DNA-binding transcriptional regulator YafY
MATNLHAYLRYDVINTCLRTLTYKITWKVLAQACYDHINEKPEFKNLKEYKMPANRTIKKDISIMRSGILGYFAPIECDYEKGYHYSDPSFSIHHVPLSATQLSDIFQAFYVLRQLTQNDNLASIKESIKLIEKKLISGENKMPQQCIFFEESTNAKGQKWLDKLYLHCAKKEALRIHYKPFEGPPVIKYCSPYYIKESNNRWYLIAGSHEDKIIHNVPLDRVEEIHKTLQLYDEELFIPHDERYGDFIGVTFEPEVPVQRIIILIKPQSARYLQTKPIHRSQHTFEVKDDGTTMISYDLRPNYEFYAKLLAYGAAIEVISPPSARQKMADEAIELLKNYQ